MLILLDVENKGSPNNPLSENIRRGIMLGDRFTHEFDENPQGGMDKVLTAHVFHLSLNSFRLIHLLTGLILADFIIFGAQYIS